MRQPIYESCRLSAGLLTLHCTDFIFRNLVDTFRVKRLRCIDAQGNLNSATRQHKELDQETTTLHRFHLIFLFVKVAKPCWQRRFKFRVDEDVFW